jgi:predicted GNAT family N-acyltransferase
MDEQIMEQTGAVNCRVIERQDAAYREELRLRYEVLRKPLGMPPGSEVNDAESSCIHVVAEVDDRLVGCVILRPDKDGAGQLMQMAVAPEFHGRGVGRKLVWRLEAHCLGAGIRRIYMHARVVAQPFYEKLGYAAAGPTFREVGIPHVYMDRELS